MDTTPYRGGLGMIRTGYSFFVVLLLSLSVFSSIYADDFLEDTLKNGAGIRALAMGGAYTAIAEGGAAVFYNPAGLIYSGGEFRNENFDYQASQYKSFTASYGFISPFGLASLRKETDTNMVDMTTIGYGRRGSKGIHWGVAYKSIHYKNATEEKVGWSADLGVLVNVTPFMNLGFVAKDVMTAYVPVSSTVAGGLAFFTPDRDFTWSLDLVQTRHNLSDHYLLKTGFEYALAEGLTLRTGFAQNYWTGGAALQLPFAALEYGFQSERETGQTLQMLGFSLGRGATPPKSDKAGRYSLFKPKAFAVFTVGSSLVGGQSEYSLFNGQKLGSNDLLYLIHNAVEDPSCRGFMIRIQPMQSGLASIGLVQELREELLKAKKKGKTIVAYLDGYGSLPEYYLASVADHITMPSLGALSHLSVSLEVLKTKDFLENFGMTPHTLSSGKYKSVLHGNTDPLDADSRLVYEDLVQDLFHKVLADIQTSRKLKWEDISQAFTGELISASQAKTYNLVDSLGYWEDVETYAEKEYKNIGKTSIVAFTDPVGPELMVPALNRIAVLEIDGPIVSGRAGQNVLFGGRSTGSEDVHAMVDDILKNVFIRGVVVRVNSPGGSLLGSDHIHKAIMRLKEKGLRVYVSMGNIAASGGYYVALPADKIYANAGTLTGSIGVVSSFMDFHELQEMLGIKREVIKSGKFADWGSANKPLEDDELAMLEAAQKQGYEAFKQKVIEGRNLTPEEVDSVAQGQVMSGEQAMKYKVIDALGNFYTVVDDLAKDINIESPELVYFRKPEVTGFPFLGNLLAQAQMAL
jgi:protease IV